MMTKGIFDEKIGKWKYVKHPNRQKTKCKLCDNEYYRLTDTHMQRKHQITIMDYFDLYPDEKAFVSVKEERDLISKHHADVSGENNPMYGVTHPPELIKQIRELSKNTIDKKHNSDEWLNMICDWCGNKFHKSPYHITMYNFCDMNCMSKWRSGFIQGENNPNWRGGISKEPYGFDFNDSLKGWIKIRDGNECIVCKSNNNLCIHHIDYNKKNNNENNLITLCSRCHGKTNGSRDIWYRLFTIGIFDYFNGGYKYDPNISGLVKI